MSLLQDAVQLAQTGRREESRQLLWQVIQGEPDNEMAWLWLASVAADQNEYQRALSEVLRINPNNQQASHFLQQFRQQQASQPAAPPAYYGTPQPPPAQRPEQVPMPAPSQAPLIAEGVRSQESHVQYTKQVEPKRRGCGCLGCSGCGCVQGCLFTLFLFVVLPAIACGLISHTSATMGPLDWIAVYFPDEFGRKEVSFDVQNDTISIDVPRSWYLADADNSMWTSWRDIFNDSLQFDDPNRKWTDFEADPTVAGVESLPISIVETNPVTLIDGGDVGILQYIGQSAASELEIPGFNCEVLRPLEETLSKQFDVETGRDFTFQIVDTGGGLCGFRADWIETYPTGRIFKDFDAPEEKHTTAFVAPVDADRATIWMVEVPAQQFELFESDIEQMIQTAALEPK